MTEYSTFDALLGSGLPEDDFTLPDGAVVRIRSLSRKQMILVQSLPDNVAIEAHVLHHGLVEPSIKLADAKRWLDAVTPGYLHGVGEAIMGLSGMNGEESGQKARFPEVSD